MIWKSGLSHSWTLPWSRRLLPPSSIATVLGLAAALVIWASVARPQLDTLLLGLVLVSLAGVLVVWLARRGSLAQERLAVQAADELELARRTHAELRAAIARHQTVIESLRGGFVILDRAGRYVHVSSGAARLMGRQGIRPGDALAIDLPEEQNEAFYIAYRRAAATRTAEEHELFYPGLQCWLATRVQPSSDTTTVFFCDITEQRRTLERAREAEESFRLFAENVQDLFWVVDVKNERPIYASPSWSLLTGLPMAALYESPRKALELVHPEDRARLCEHLQRCCAEADGQRLEIEFRIVRPDGDVRWIQQRSVALPHAESATTRMCGIACDVTERKKMEASLRDSEARLLLSERMASLGTLAAGVGHEINNPLTYLMCNLEIAQRNIATFAKEHPGDDSAKRTVELLGIALEGSCRIRDIVRELRVFSRGESEQVGAVDAVACMEAALNIALNQVRHRARVVRNFEHVPNVRANEVRLGQVFLNLVVNAAQAMPEGQADKNRLTVGAYFETSTKQVVFEVTDTGTGIAPELLGRIFDPFFTTKSCGEGTGLGLFLAQQAVHSYGGAISVESQVGKGSTFRVRLACEQAPAQRPASTRTEGSPATRRARVLVIDDEREVGFAVAAMLENEHEVTTTEHGNEALNLVEQGAFDLVLCDLMMPTMSASEFFAELKRVAPEQVQRVCFMTGGVFTDSARAFLDEAGRPVINKPFTLAGIRSLVAQSLAS
jgi:PAS domain S-box-containing protein